MAHKSLSWWLFQAIIDALKLSTQPNAKLGKATTRRARSTIPKGNKGFQPENPWRFQYGNRFGTGGRCPGAGRRVVLTPYDRLLIETNWPRYAEWTMNFQLDFLDGWPWNRERYKFMTPLLSRQLAFSRAVMDKMFRAGVLPTAEEMWEEEGC